MKKTSILLFVVVATLSITLSSCDIDIIDSGYNPAARVAGRYWVEEYSQTFDEYTEFEIRVYERGYNSVLISNFYGTGVDVNAEVRGNILYIPFQTRDGYEIEGRATISYGQLRFNYTVRDTYDNHWVRNVCVADAWIH